MNPDDAVTLCEPAGRPIFIQGPLKQETTMSRTITAIFTAVLLTAAATMLSACDTVAGAGQDVSHAGQAVTGAADGAKH
jgi:predicted small secreted protein